MRPPSNLPPPPTGSKWTRTCAEHTQKKGNKCDSQSWMFGHRPLRGLWGDVHARQGRRLLVALLIVTVHACVWRPTESRAHRIRCSHAWRQ